MSTSLAPSEGAWPLRIARLTLRPHRSDDADPLQRIYGQADVARFLLEEPWTVADAQHRVAERIPRTGLDSPAGALALVIEHDGTVIGDVALWFSDREQQTAEIGWVLDPARGGQGLATEAVNAVLDLAVVRWDLHRIIARMDARNTASAALAERVGMRREAHFRRDWWSKGEWTDTLVYATLAEGRRLPPEGSGTGTTALLPHHWIRCHAHDPHASRPSVRRRLVPRRPRRCRRSHRRALRAAHIRVPRRTDRRARCRCRCPVRRRQRGRCRVRRSRSARGRSAVQRRARRRQLERILADEEAPLTHGTVGAVARDSAGRIVAGTSTGGISKQLRGRIGDTPIIGAGTWARDGVVGISCTGDGEAFIQGAVAHDVFARMAYGRQGIAEAASSTFAAECDTRGSTGGLIAVTGDGSVLLCHNSAMMLAAFSQDDEIVTWV